jgi:hypothetical protein
LVRAFFDGHSNKRHGLPGLGITRKEFKALAVALHEDGGVTIGLAGDPGNYARVHDALKDNLDQLASHLRINKDKINVAPIEVDLQGYMSVRTKRVGKEEWYDRAPGFCAEPRVCAGLSRSESPVNALSVIWRGPDGKNPVPRGPGKKDKHFMFPCETCSVNQGKMLDEAYQKWPDRWR